MNKLNLEKCVCKCSELQPGEIANFIEIQSYKAVCPNCGKINSINLVPINWDLIIRNELLSVRGKKVQKFKIHIDDWIDKYLKIDLDFSNNIISIEECEKAINTLKNKYEIYDGEKRECIK